MIVASAIKIETGEIFSGKRHNDILYDLWENEVTRKRNRDNDIHGFILDNGTFLDRYEAKEYAVEHNQILPNCGEYAELYSEDLW